MFGPCREAVWPGIERVKVRMRLENHIDLARYPPSRRRGMRKDCRLGFLGLRVVILRWAALRSRQTTQNNYREQDRKKWTCSQQSLNLTDREFNRLGI